MQNNPTLRRVLTEQKLNVVARDFFTVTKKYDRITYKDVMAGELGVMDQTAITLCKENALPLIVLNIHTPGIVQQALRGEPVGTLVT